MSELIPIASRSPLTSEVLFDRPNLMNVAYCGGIHTMTYVMERVLETARHFSGPQMSIIFQILLSLRTYNPDSEMMALISFAMYCTGVPVGGMGRS